MAFANLGKQLRKLQVAGELWLLKMRVARPAEVILRKTRYAFASHGSAQQPGLHRRIDDHPNIVCRTERKNVVLDVSCDDRVRWLQGSNRSDTHGPFHLPDVKIRDADRPHLALFL